MRFPPHGPPDLVEFVVVLWGRRFRLPVWQLLQLVGSSEARLGGSPGPGGYLSWVEEVTGWGRTKIRRKAGLMLDLTRLAGRRVDLVSKKGLKQSIRAAVLSEARPLYAA